ncbi:MAG: GspH/FimT family pseudopilin [Deltaproteobacteria bacterium]|nr:GspH/FimT family pseudopilin [Deltaproteobacteria bacterium]
MSKLMHQQNSKLESAGFTLVELMVTVAIMAIIAGFTFGNLNSTSYKLKSSARTLQAKMQQAKLLAVKENCNVFVDFDLDGDSTIDSFYTLWRDADNDNSYDDPVEHVERVALPILIAFGSVAGGDGGPTKGASPTSTVAPEVDGISFSGNSVRFNPEGTASNGWAYLHAPNKDSAGTYAAGSNNVGRVQIRHWVTEGGTWR